MATVNASVKRARRPSAVSAPVKSASAPRTPPPPGVSDAALTTLVRTLLQGQREALSVALLAVTALQRQGHRLDEDVVAALRKSVNDKLYIERKELERLLTALSPHPVPQSEKNKQ